jgi:tetratricopeptide (TPR) repeat protein
MKATWLVIAALMAGLYGVDKSLASLEAREVSKEARDHYRNGRRLLAAGEAPAAIDEFRRAHTLERTNRDFELALASAQLTAGRSDEAEHLAEEILNRNSNDGRANYLLARIRAAQDRFDDSVSFYHRAIYGSWPDGSAADKTNARLELAGYLAQRGRNAELLSELLLLDGSSSANARRIAELYLAAGSTARAEAAYRSILKQDPNDTAAWAGLGEAELKRGEYRLAHAAFGAVVNLDQGNTTAEARVQLSDQLTKLDPTSRHLGSLEKFKRSREILDLVEAETITCLQGQIPPDALHNQFASAEKLKGEKTASMPSNEAAETRLELAGEIWKARLQACKTRPGDDDPLALLISKISQ